MFQQKTVAKALIYDGDGRILVLRRSSTHPIFAHHFDFPGGNVEPGEDPLTGVVREIYEEVNLTLSGDDVALVHEVDNNVSGWHYVIYEVRLPERSPVLAISWEHDRSEWLTYDELMARPLPPNTDAYYLAVLNYLRSR